MTLSPNLPSPANPRQVWAEYILRLPQVIGLPYEYVAHFTYRDHSEIPRAHQADITAKRFRYFLGEINRRLYGKRWIRKGQGVFGAIATEKIPDFPHHHAILGGQGLRAGLRRLEIMDMWDGLFGIARVTDYRGDAAAGYLVKYVTKGGIVDVFAGSRDRERLRT